MEGIVWLFQEKSFFKMHQSSIQGIFILLRPSYQDSRNKTRKLAQIKLFHIFLAKK